MGWGCADTRFEVPLDKDGSQFLLPASVAKGAKVNAVYPGIYSAKVLKPKFYESLLKHK